VIEARSLISWNVAPDKHPYTDGKIVKKKVYEVVSVLYTKKGLILLRLNTNSSFASRYGGAYVSYQCRF
jgi:hypothetical protein